MDPDQKQLRLESCVQTIIAVHKMLARTCFDRTLMDKFEELEQAMQSIQANGISEKEIARVEEATNRLLNELKDICTITGRSPWHSAQPH